MKRYTVALTKTIVVDVAATDEDAAIEQMYAKEDLYLEMWANADPIVDFIDEADDA